MVKPVPECQTVPDFTTAGDNRGGDSATGTLFKCTKLQLGHHLQHTDMQAGCEGMKGDRNKRAAHTANILSPLSLVSL